MDKNQTEKSQAELYREERKQRMEKAAKKNATKSPQLAKFGRILGKCCGVIIIAALCLTVIYGILSFFGVPQKVATAAKIGNKRVSVAKYDFYYYDIYNQVYSKAAQYENYGSGMGRQLTGFDITKAPEDQSYPSTLEGYDNPTWADYIRETALTYLQSYITYSQLAKDKGLTVTDDQNTELEEQIKQLTTYADNNDYSLNRYLTKIYGKGVNEKLLREIYEERYLATNYASDSQKEISAAVTDEEINAEYDANIQSYTKFSVNLFEVTAVTQDLADDATEEQKTAAQTAAMAEAKTLADGYLAKITNAESVLNVATSYKSTSTEASVNLVDTNAETVKKSYGENTVNWIYSADRKVGDKAVIETDGGYVVIYMVAVPHRENTNAVDVRHILVQFNTTTDSNGNKTELTEAQKATYYAKAEEIYNTFLQNPTEENFAALAKEKSEDTGSKENGGLYENVAPGDMVDGFNDWIFDEARKPGDVAIVETTYGYHVMYFVSNDNEPVWKLNCRSAITTNKFTESDTNLMASDEHKITKHDKCISWGSEQMNKIIKNFLANSKKSSSSYSTSK